MDPSKEALMILYGDHVESLVGARLQGGSKCNYPLKIPGEQDFLEDV
jgi:hypothetical protein